ncbi:MAG TPA: hypothetical protein VMT85_12690 [Thermoanaerobaculia bacterium]|nr:hypothetical protein [Thermoanaerobaculia bacterium]
MDTKSRNRILFAGLGLACALVGAAAAQAGSTMEAPNLVPNPTFVGDIGQALGEVTGAVPALWRAFGVGGGAVQVQVQQVAAGALFAGSPATGSVRLTATGAGGDAGFDHEAHRFSLVAGQTYQAQVYLRSGNAGGASQTVSISFPVFENGVFSGRQPGSFTAEVDGAWRLYTGPAFTEAAGATGDLAFRVVDDGGSNAIQIALPTVLGPLPPYPQITREGRAFSLTDRYVAATFFHWYVSNGGQLQGAWPPLEGRAGWTGDVPFWRRQIKDVMDAGIDVLYVHLFPEQFETTRIDIFRALSELRSEGYDTPKVAPFLDPVITWGPEFSPEGGLDLATSSGKDEFVDQYVRWYEQYFAASRDPAAESFVLRIDSRAGLDVWAMDTPWNLNVAALSRADVENRLRAAFAGRTDLFDDGVYLIATENRAPAWADEQMYQFSNTEYFSAFQVSGVRTATLKPGYWDQNIRDPGIFLARDGGVPYRNAWDDLLATAQGGGAAAPIYHAYIESWNEYDESTGIYAADPGPPVIGPGNDGGNDDTWSSSDNPREYIETTAAGAADFRGDPARDAVFLWHDVPTEVDPGAPIQLRFLVRNTGSAEWSGAGGYALVQRATDPVILGGGRIPVDDVAVETAIYGGAFRGRPVLFELQAQAPAADGIYQLNWQMTGNGGGQELFGEVLGVTLVVGDPPIVGPCVGSPTAVCLADDQFEVTGTIVANGAGGPEERPLQLVELTADTGYGWFLNDQNLEVFVKVLDACGVNGRYWVFFGGLTDLEVDLRVRSAINGQVLTKSNPPGTGFQTEANTGFFTCGGGAASRPPARPPSDREIAALTVEHLAQSARDLATRGISRPIDAARAHSAGIAPCVAGATTLCLTDDRFEVTGTIVANVGAGAEERALQLVAVTGDTGYGWFLNDENLEVFVKVLDACGVNGKYWVFFGGLTDLEVDLEVRSTLTGQMLRKTNPPGTAFQTEANTGFFDCQ